MQIPLTQGKFTIIDDDDYQNIAGRKWTAFWDGYNWYAISHHLYMHRVLMGVQRGERIDHRDGDGLNNRRENLRHCTNQQNAHNSRPRSNKLWPYKGVSFHKNKRKYFCQIAIDGKHRNLGQFDNPLSAAILYDKVAREHFGAFARPNFP